MNSPVQVNVLLGETVQGLSPQLPQPKGPARSQRGARNSCAAKQSAFISDCSPYDIRRACSTSIKYCLMDDGQIGMKYTSGILVLVLVPVGHLRNGHRPASRDAIAYRILTGFVLHKKAPLVSARVVLLALSVQSCSGVGNSRTLPATIAHN